MLVSAPLEDINTNYTFLASFATSVKGTESRSDRNMKAAMEEDDTPGKKKLYKIWYRVNSHLQMHFDILKNMERYVKNRALTYWDIWIYMNTFNIYMICHKKANYYL